MAANPPSVHFTPKESNDYLALKCIFRLINPDSRSIRLIEFLLRNRFDSTRVFSSDQEAATSPTDWPFYPYACKNWHLHLMESANSFKLLQHVSLFLKGLEFITWAEMKLTDGVDVGPIVDIHASLCAWDEGLDEAQKKRVQISTFMGKPYNDFFSLPEINRNMPDVAYMALRRLGQYHNANGTLSGGRTLKELRKMVAEGFVATLGDKHALTLECMAEWGIEQIADDERELLEGATLLRTTMNQQRKVLGTDVYDSYYSQLNLGLALFYQALFEDSIQHLEESCTGLIRTLGANHHHYQFARLYYAYALEGLSEVSRACQIYKNIWAVWSQIHGTQHPLSLMAQCGMGVAFRKLQKFDMALKHLHASFAERQRSFGKSTVTVDNSIHLALLYRDMGEIDQARAYLELTKEVGLDECDCSFERYTQVEHLRALLHLDCGDTKSAKEVLEDLLRKSKPLPANRSGLWARLTLADILRDQGHPKRASSLFSGMVEPVRESDAGRIRSGDPTDWQRAVEQFLRDSQAKGVRSATEELERNGLRWRHPQSLWIIAGGPAAEVYR